MVLKELSKEELLNEELALDAWADAKYDALEDEKEEAVLCGYCKVPMDGEELIPIFRAMKADIECVPIKAKPRPRLPS